MDQISQYMNQLGRQARQASLALAKANSSQKNKALSSIANSLDKNRQPIFDANKKDMQQGKENGLDAALLDRLELTPARLDGMIEGILQVAALDDPIGEISDLKYRPSGIQLGKMRVPLGVVGIIYESRPNVTADAAALCLKSGNAAILRGGSEAINSNQAIALSIAEGLEDADLPVAAVQVVNTIDRAAVGALISMPEYVDVIVPRGGKGLIERVSREATVPVIKHLDGICHVYIDDDADIEKAVSIAFNAKTHRYGTCNTMETLLVADSIASKVLPKLQEKYVREGVELRGCSKTQTIIDNVNDASELDWQTEYLAPILSIRIVENIDQAITHIQQYSSQHTDAIVTENYTKSRQFITEVDSSSVIVNASTRFADGFEYGLGAEIGISTDKFHVRGPVGLDGLTSQKYIVFGDGQVRE